MTFDRHTLNRIYRYCLSLTGDSEAAYDLMQTSLEKYLRTQTERAEAESAQPSNPIAYLFRIVRNAFIDSQRRARVRQHEPLDEELSQAVDPSMVARTMRSLDEVVIEREQVAAILAQISPRNRELLFLWAVEGYTIQEIADLTKTPKGTLLSRVHRLRQKVLQLLESGPGGEAKEAWG